MENSPLAIFDKIHPEGVLSNLPILKIHCQNAEKPVGNPVYCCCSALASEINCTCG